MIFSDKNVPVCINKPSCRERDEQIYNNSVYKYITIKKSVDTKSL